MSDGCGLVRSVTARNGMPLAWFLDGRPAPGWRMVRDDEGGRSDYCPRCKRQP